MKHDGHWRGEWPDPPPPTLEQSLHQLRLAWSDLLRATGWPQRLDRFCTWLAPKLARRPRLAARRTHDVPPTRATGHPRNERPTT